MHCKAERRDVRGNRADILKLYEVLRMRKRLSKSFITILSYLPHYCPLPLPPFPSPLTSYQLIPHRRRPSPILQPHPLAHHRRRRHRHPARLVHGALYRPHLPEYRSRHVRTRRRGILGYISQYVLAPTAPIPDRWTKQ
jgi:hypothetical protein